MLRLWFADLDINHLAVLNIDQALFLKELDVFEQVSVEHLVELAVLAEEAHFDPGVDIIRGDLEETHLVADAMCGTMTAFSS